MAKKKREEKPKEYTRRQLSHFQRQKRRQRIILISGVSIIAAIVIIVLLGWFLGEYRPMHRTVIKVNDTEFSAAYFIDMLKIMSMASPDQPLDTLSQNLADNIIQTELIRQEAEALGITIDDDEIRKTLEDAGVPVTDAYIDIMRVQQLQTRLRDEHFGAQVPVSDNQVNMMAMFVENENVAQEIIEKLAAGDNFTALAEQYGQNYYSKNDPHGDFGWHPASILKDQLGSMIPIDFAFGAEPGTLSPPLSDNASYKQLGYWLIDVLGISEEDDAEVQALLLSSRDEAVDVKARLESGDNLSALAEQYSQYSPSKQNGGKLEPIARPTANATAVSAPFDAYVFNSETEFGKWSDPIQDTQFWTQGGAWIVKVVEKENDRELTSEDRNILINKAYSEWSSQLLIVHATEVDTSGLTEEVRAWAVERATKELQQAVGG